MAKIINRTTPVPPVDDSIRTTQRLEKIEQNIQVLNNNAINTNKTLLANLTGGLRK